MKTSNRRSLLLFVAIATSYGVSPAFSAPILSSDLASFTVLGASTVTNVPPSTIVGNVGVWSSGGANAITGFNSSPGVATSDPQVTGGMVHAGTALAQAAQSDLTVAINSLSSLGPGTLLPADLVGLIITPGVYTVPAGVTNLSGAFTLNGEGNANAAWVFQMPSTLITSPNALVNMINAGDGSGLFWNVGSNATIDVNTSFLGNILALNSISINTASTIRCGRALASVGAVTLQMNSLSGVCSGELAGSNGLGGGFDVVATPGGGTELVTLPFVLVDGGGEPTPIPESSSILLMGIGLGALSFARRRRLLSIQT